MIDDNTLAIIAFLCFSAGLACLLALPILYVFDITKWVRFKLGICHQWTYRNQYDRTCDRCGLNQQEHGWAHHPDSGWWEDMNEPRIGDEK